jgi:hypothetical protein
MGVLLCCFAFLAVLGGGSTCTWSSNHHDDDDEFDDDDTNLVHTEGGSDAVDDDAGSLRPSPDAIRRGLLDLDRRLGTGAGRETGADLGNGPGIPGDALGAGQGLLSNDLAPTGPGAQALRLTHYAVDLEPRAGRHPVARLRDIQGLSVFHLGPRGAVGAAEFSTFSAHVLAANPELLGLPPTADPLVPRRVSFQDEIIAVVYEQVTADGAPAHLGDSDDGQMIFVFDLLGRLLQIENRTLLPPGVVVTVPEDLLSPQ